MGNLLEQFENWKGSTFEISVWAKIALDEKKKQIGIQPDGYETTARFSLQAASKLRRTRSFDDLPS